MAAIKKCALLIAAGEISENVFKKVFSKKKLCIAIDGGYNYCIDSGFIPDVVIGDFDSLDYSLINEEIISIHQESQEETDLSKAINWTLSKGIKDIELNTRISGSAALDMAYVASGRLDGFFQKNLNIWDIAAGIIILNEAGGKISPLDIKTTKNHTVIASSEIIYSELNKLLIHF